MKSSELQEDIIDITESLTPNKKKETPHSSPDSSPAVVIPKPLVLNEELASSITMDICNGLF